jgi:hypothetical protein
MVLFTFDPSSLIHSIVFGKLGTQAGWGLGIHVAMQTSWPNADFLILLHVRFVTKPMKRSSMFLSLVFSYSKSGP